MMRLRLSCKRQVHKLRMVPAREFVPGFFCFRVGYRCVTTGNNVSSYSPTASLKSKKIDDLVISPIEMRYNINR